jgi:hypothetical protein
MAAVNCPKCGWNKGTITVTHCPCCGERLLRSPKLAKHCTGCGAPFRDDAHRFCPCCGACRREC